jgi:membrane associated rhomboid family serine protease
MKIADSKTKLVSDFKDKTYWILGFVVVVWVVALVNLLLGYRLDAWGLYPRSIKGLVGIFLSPFLHYGLRHVLANTIPFIVLGSLVILRGIEEFLELSLFIIVVGGAAVWLLGRPAYHVGASGLIMGYFGYLVARGWYERSFTSLIIAIFVVVFYGGAMWSVLPGAWRVSWEMHLFGLISGVLAARLLPTRPASSQLPGDGAHNWES